MNNEKDNWSVDKQIIDNSQKRTSSTSINKIMWNIISGGVAVILVVVTFVQLLEVSRLKGYIEATQINGASAQTVTPATSASPQRPASGLPSQVGGC